MPAASSRRQNASRSSTSKPMWSRARPRVPTGASTLPAPKLMFMPGTSVVDSMRPRGRTCRSKTFVYQSSSSSNSGVKKWMW